VAYILDNCPPDDCPTDNCPPPPDDSHSFR
jgi:hypothetical protein